MLYLHLLLCDLPWQTPKQTQQKQKNPSLRMNIAGLHFGTTCTYSICDFPCLLTYLDNFGSNRHKADATTRTRRPAEALVGLPLLRQPLPPVLPPLLSHNLLSLLAIFLRLHPLHCRNFCGHSISPGVTSSTADEVRFFCIP